MTPDLSNIIVAFSKRENAVNIRNILVKSGFEVSAVCQTGAKVLQYAEMWNDGIVVCADRMQDNALYTDEGISSGRVSIRISIIG